jgi:LuxR family maltose regulon positive regulatory protein
MPCPRTSWGWPPNGSRVGRHPASDTEPVAREQIAKRARLRTTFSALWETRLDAELDQLLEYGCISIEAPAGSGKSRLVSRWRRLLVGSGRTAHAISCTEAVDRDRLLTTLEELTAAHRPSQGRSRLTNLIEEWGRRPEGLAILLDDVDSLPAEAVSALAVVAARLPGNCLMVLTGRSAPDINQASLIAAGRLKILGRRQLLLKPEEALEILSDAEERGCSAAALAHVVELCGGWQIALQCAAQSLQEAADAEAVAKAFGPRPTLSEWLVENVWSHLDSSDQAFLIDLAPVSEQVLDAPLVAALTGEGDAPQRLSRLRATTPFFTLDASGELRFHPLAAAFLQMTQGDDNQEHQRKQHEHATRWLASQSSPQAVAHAIASGDLDQARRLVEDVLLKAVSHGMGREALDWLRAIPMDGLRLGATTVCAMAVLGLRAEVLDWLATVPDDLHDPRTADPRRIIEALLAAGADDPDLTQELLSKLSPVIEVEDTLLSVERNLRRWLAQQQGSNKTFVSTTLPADDVRRDIRQFSTGYCTAVFRDMEVLLDTGQAVAAERLVRRARQVAIRRLGEHANPTVQLTAGLAAACRQLSNFEEARTLMLGWPETDTDWMAPSTLWLGHATLARVAASEGRVEVGIGTLRRLIDTSLRRNLFKVRAQALAEIIRLALASGRVGVARKAADGLSSLSASADQLGPIRGGLTRLAATLGLACFAIHQGERSQAASHLGTAATLAERYSRPYDLAAVALMHASMENADPMAPTGDAPLSMIGAADLATLQADLNSALNLPRQAPLGTTHTPHKAKEPAIVLTMKEREVLELMSRGVPKRLIGEALFVSPETIKWHQKNIYSKFDVRDRHNVVQVARRLGIV